ncbi:hypothetical protein GCM10022224_080450 [Nonomuraea antimicrobica]|uniref:Uncharacterized protein n=1 Tax=Nonomuraea antimicrobica TaxID=561173 RepID=A0ABP7D8Z7_9ACTN
MADNAGVDLDQLVHDVLALLTAAGFPYDPDHEASGFQLRRGARSIEVTWGPDAKFEDMLIDLDDDHPMLRLERDVVNITLKAFAEIFVAAGFTVSLRLGNSVDRDVELKVIAGPADA